MGRDLDVLADGQVGHQVVELEDEAELVAAVLAELLGRQAGKLRAAHVDGAAIGRLQAAHQVQKRRFAAARRTEQYANLAFVHRGGDVVQHRGARLAFAVMLAQIANLQVRRRGGGGGAGCGCGVLSHVVLLRGKRLPASAGRTRKGPQYSFPRETIYHKFTAGYKTLGDVALSVRSLRPLCA